MSEEVKTQEQSAPAEIMPAKSEDKLEIEKEEQEQKEAENKDTEKEKEETEEKKEETEKEEKKEENKEEEEKKEGEEAKKEESSDEVGETKEKKKFKISNLKTPKVPEFFRSKSKDRKKEPAEGDEPKEDGGQADDQNEDDDKAEKTEASTSKAAKTRVMEAIEGIHLPKISKPGFLKKQKKPTEGETEKKEEDKEEKKEEAETETDKKEEEDKDKDKETNVEEDNKEKEEGGENKETNIEEMKEKEGGEETKETEEQTEEEKKKKSGLLDSFKNIKCQVFGAKKSKDVTDGDKEESAELLEKKSEDKEKTDEEEEETEEKKDKPATSLLNTIRNVASHVPGFFKKEKDKEPDVEAGEKEELLEKDDDVTKEKKEGDDDQLDEVKVDKKDPDSASQGSEKKDPEKTETEKEENMFCKRIGQAKSQFDQLDNQKKLGLIGIVSGVVLLLIIIIICCTAIPSRSRNHSKLVEDGKFVETHSICGPVQGLVEGPDMFSFTGIPYAVPVMGADRWTHSKPISNLSECHEGTFIAHSNNSSRPENRCWRKYPTGSETGNENCLTLDIFTPNVVYDPLLPVVVYIDGDDLSENDDQTIRPTAALAKNQSIVFVSVNYRRAILGFLSLDALSQRAYPNTSGNYGLGDIIAALEWIKLNINHFGGHPNQVTLLGRGSGASLVTALTASPKTKDLFQRVWVSNGAGIFENKTLEQANKENKVIVDALNCGADVADCLVDASAEDLTKVIPYEWQDTRQRELPQVGEKGHSWIVFDKDIIMESPKVFWSKNKLSNIVPIVFGATAHAEVTADDKEFMDWTNSDKFAAHVESKLGSFNTTIPAQAMTLYNFTENGIRNHWLEYASMLSDIRTVCPLQELAAYVSSNFVADIYSYVVTQKRSGVLDGIADKTSDLAAIFGVYNPANEDEMKFTKNMQTLFYNFVKSGTLPHGNTDLTKGMYIVDKTIKTEKSYPNCEFWRKAHEIVPNYGNMD